MVLYRPARPAIDCPEDPRCASCQAQPATHETPPPLQIDRLRKVIGFAVRHPERVYMGTWLELAQADLPHLTDEGPESIETWCGTTGCIAGWGSLLYPTEVKPLLLAIAEDGRNAYQARAENFLDTHPEAGYATDLEFVANFIDFVDPMLLGPVGELLGLTADEAKRLFLGTSAFGLRKVVEVATEIAAAHGYELGVPMPKAPLFDVPVGTEYEIAE